ncbi:hypothetical protein BDV93DRAFT_562945 [Ceratobasidium sp. AG-I]|nr:hypothetical protein BDV93DRAFT_562945 [Ceratobasidium sp. AG-I]
MVAKISCRAWTVLDLEAGILPRDFLTYPPYQEEEDDTSSQDEPDPETVLFDYELNRCLVEGLADGAMLTVIFDCCHSGGLTVLVPDFEDVSHIRHRHLLMGKVIRSRSSGGGSSLESSLFGNLLGLPLKMDLANSSSEATLDRSQLEDDSMDNEDASAEAINMNFQPFPANCEVVSWSACERGQLAREDSCGGRFTNAFMAGMKSNTSADGGITYRLLNRFIHTLFNEHNKSINETNDNKVRVRGEASADTCAIRASVNESVEQGKTREFQYPKLHVSANIKDTFADQPFSDKRFFTAAPLPHFSPQLDGPWNDMAHVGLKVFWLPLDDSSQYLQFPSYDIHRYTLEDPRARGRANHSVAAAHRPSGPFETRVPPKPEPRQPWVPEEPPLPAPVYPSQPRANTVFEQALNTPLLEFEQKKQAFEKLFDSHWWNLPGERLDGMDVELEKSRALVIAITYGASDPLSLPATYVDAFNIICLLEQQFDYPPKAIRVLADQVDMQNRKDNRWPNKENILKGLHWLNEGSVAGSRRFLFFAGHGHSLNLEQGGVLYTHEGILPRNFWTYTPRQNPNDPTPVKDQPDPETVLFDDELNECLVKGLADGAKLTVIFDCCHSGGLTVLVPEFADMSHIRHRHLFTGEVVRSRGSENDCALDSSLSGNPLGLPLKVDLASSAVDESLHRSQLGGDSVMVHNSSIKRINMEFKGFPKNCEVISWSACERGQLAREDSRGGRFTNAFIVGMKPAPSTNEKATYRMLNRSIQTQFEEHNRSVSPPSGNKVRGGEEPESSNTDRASINESVEHRERQGYQYPKLYVSANIASTFADRIVII